MLHTVLGRTLYDSLWKMFKEICFSGQVGMGVPNSGPGVRNLGRLGGSW